MKLLVIGFNARPIAKSAFQAGHSIGVVDYFGDMDLVKLTKNCFSVLRQKPGQILHRPLHRKPAEYLYYLAEIMSDEQADFDGIIIGSAFDQYPDLVKKLSDIGPKVYVNDIDKFALIRNKKKINDIAEKAGFSIPRLISVKNKTELIEIAKTSQFPLVTRGSGGGGGAGIRLWNNLEDLTHYFSERENEFDEGVWIQEHIIGLDASSSVICHKDTVQILSINRQLIGEKKLGAPSDFAYAGNIVPLHYENYLSTPTLLKTHIEQIRGLFRSLELKGSNGIDFVIKDEKLYFMEINPRFQGSIECVQYATGYNVVQLHLDAFNGITHDLPLIPRYKKNAVKGILFSDHEENFQVKYYPRNKWIVDRTHFKVILERTDPFCSIVLPTRNQAKGYDKVCSLAEEIISKNTN